MRRARSALAQKRGRSVAVDESSPRSRRQSHHGVRSFDAGTLLKILRPQAPRPPRPTRRDPRRARRRHLRAPCKTRRRRSVARCRCARQSSAAPSHDRCAGCCRRSRSRGGRADCRGSAWSQADKFSAPYTNEFGKIVESEGGEGMNAETNLDETVYFYSFPINRLELWGLSSNRSVFCIRCCGSFTKSATS